MNTHDKIDECLNANGYFTIRPFDGSTNGDTDSQPIATVYNEANAKLIAAAPETAAERNRLIEQNTLFRRDNAKLREQKLELLAACMARLKEWHGNLRNFYRQEPPSLEMMRAAIDKTTEAQ